MKGLSDTGDSDRACNVNSEKERSSFPEDTIGKLSRTDPILKDKFREWCIYAESRWNDSTTRAKT